MDTEQIRIPLACGLARAQIPCRSHAGIFSGEKPAASQAPSDIVTQPTNRPKRHHFIPQMMLRHFADADGRLWYWQRSLAEGDVRKASTKDLFVQKELYTFVTSDGTKDVALETFFSNLEGAGASFITQLADIVRNGAIPKLDENAWQLWGQFFYYHLKRTPGAIAFFADQMNLETKIVETVKKIQAIRAETGGDPDEPGLEGTVRQNAIVRAQHAPPSTEVLKAFATLGLAVYWITDPTKSFIVADAPGATAKFRMPNGAWSRPTLFLPLTWDIAVGQLQGGRKVEIIPVDRDQVRRMNEASTARSTAIAGRSEALIGSLACNVPYRGIVALDKPS